MRRKILSYGSWPALLAARFRSLRSILFVCLGGTLLSTAGFAQSSSAIPDLQQLLQSKLGQMGSSTDTTLSNLSQSPLVLNPDNPSEAPQLPLSRLEQILSARANVKLTQFGYDQFGIGRTVTVPQGGAVQDDYILGSGDQIVVSLRGQEDSEYRVDVTRDGQVVLPRLGPILAAGRTLRDFRADLLNAVRRAYVQTQAFVSIGRIRQISVMVSGEVNNPGSRLVTGLSTPVDAILLSGGIKKSGSLRNVRVIRSGTEITVDLYSVLTQRGRVGQMLLTDGDRIVVPPLGRTVAVAGWVRRQGIYELPPGQAGMSIRSLLALGGGLEVRGRYNMSVLRLLPSGINSLVPTQSETGVVHDGEILFVRPGAQQTESQATLSGGSPLAGAYAVSKATKLSSLLNAPGALGTAPYTLLGLIVRKDPSTQMRVLVPFTPTAVLSGSEDLDVVSNDVVRIFTVKEARLLSAVTTEFQRLLDIAKNQDQLDISQLQDQTAGAGSADSSQPDPGKNIPMLVDQTGSGFATGDDERKIMTLLVSKTLDESGRLSDRPATNERSPYGFNLAQRNYLRDQLDIQNSLNSTNQTHDWQGGGADSSSDNINSQQALNAYARLGSNQANSSDVGQNSSGTSQRQFPPSQSSLGSPYGNSSQNSPNGELTAPNMERQQTAPYEVPTNTDVQTFGQLSRQIGVDPLILVHFFLDHRVTLDGSVRSAGLYLVGPHATMKDVVSAAGGLSSWTDRSNFEVISTSLLPDTGRAHTEHKLLVATDETLSTYVVKAQDEIRFNQIFTDAGIGTVTIKGQTRFPGTYHITRGERLSELLLRAGGLTDQAYPYGTVFLRKSAAAVERDGYRRVAEDMDDALAEGLTRTGDKKVDPSSFTAARSFVTELRNTPALGRISVVADPAMLAADPSRDTLLEPGDVVFIPQRPSTVAILGQVMQPTTVTYNPKMSASDYIALAGGYGQFADESRAFLVLPDGSARRLDSSWFNLDNPSIPPGSTLVVPRDMTPFDLRQTILDTAQVLSSLAVAAASIAVISRNN